MSKKIEETTELATAGTTELSTVGSMGDYMEELDGLGSLSFEKIKIPSGGGIAFEVPGDDPESPEIQKAIEGVIVHHQTKNVYFRDAYTGATEEGNQPDCASADGKTGVMRDSGTEKSCATCKYNQFGSGRDGFGKACQNRVDLYILMDGEVFPKVLSLPATSLKDFKAYLAMRVVARKQKLCQVRTRITLKKAKSKSGIDYSTCVFAKAGDVPQDQLPDILEMKELCRGIALSQAFQAVEEQEYTDLTATTDEELPFD